MWAWSEYAKAWGIPSATKTPPRALAQDAPNFGADTRTPDEIVRPAMLASGASVTRTERPHRTRAPNVAGCTPRDAPYRHHVGRALDAAFRVLRRDGVRHREVTQAK
jgi:hypothetical protein